MEKSTIPNMGLLRSMPFQLTAVCEGAVPRSEAVARVARPDDLMNIVLFLANTSAIDNVTLSDKQEKEWEKACNYYYKWSGGLKIEWEKNCETAKEALSASDIVSNGDVVSRTDIG